MPEEHIIDAANAAAEVVRAAANAAAEVVRVAAQTAAVQSESMRVDLTYIKEDLKEIKARLDSRFVSVEAFDPIRRLVYGLVALMLTGVVVALIALVVKTP